MKKVFILLNSLILIFALCVGASWASPFLATDIPPTGDNVTASKVQLQLPEFLDLNRITVIAGLILAIIQYVKSKLPDWIIKPYLQLVLGIFLSWWWGAYTLPAGTPLWSINWVFVVTNGITAAIFADTGFNFLSAKPGSPAFTLPRKTGIDPSGVPGG